MPTTMGFGGKTNGVAAATGRSSSLVLLLLAPLLLHGCCSAFVVPPVVGYPRAFATARTASPSGGVAAAPSLLLRASSPGSDDDDEEEDEEEVDVIVIGSGIGGLSCAALLAASGRTVRVLERHYEIGGCAHEYAVDLETGTTIPSALLAKDPTRQVFRFEAGPSLYSGMSPTKSPNPLKHIYQMIDEEPEWITYDIWGAFLPEAPEGYELSIGAENFKTILQRYGGEGAVEDWAKLSAILRPMAGGIMSLPSTAVRGDAGIFLTLGAKYPLAFLNVLKYATQITAPFDLDKLGVKNEFLRNYLDLLAFLLQGMPADQTLTAVMAYMVEDFYREDAVMDFPRGGSGAMMDALARGVTKHGGCSVDVSTEVEEIVIDEEGRAAGVRLKGKSGKGGGKVIKAKEAVVSNADLYHTFKFVEEGINADFDKERDQFFSAATPAEGSVPFCKSFMHVHLGVPAHLIPDDAPPQWTVVRDWSLGIDAPGNVVVVSVPSKLDPTLAPDGYHVIHAYGAGNEPYEAWEQFEHLTHDAAARAKNAEYQAFKVERSQPIWDAIGRRAPMVIPGAATVEQIATPITHARFLTRYRGNYGLAIAPNNPEGWVFPQVTTPIKGLYRCGDSTTAGIGIPAVASSGAQCANAILSVWEQLELNSKIRM